MPQKTDAASRAKALEAEISALQEILGADEDAQKIVNKHIRLLHCYNEAKDATQILIGKLAFIRQLTVRELHEAYGLTDDD